MASQTETSAFDGLLRWLAAYRLVVYVGGLLAIASPRFLRTTADVTVGPTLRTVIVVTSLVLMILTYLGERRGKNTTSRRGDSGTDRARFERTTADAASEPDTEPSNAEESGGTAQYSRRTRAVFAAGVVGVVFGIYVALEASLPAGLLFVFGAILFVQSAYRRERGGEAE